MFICKHCKKKFNGFNTSQKANHSRWCDENPKRQEYVQNLTLARKSITSESRAKVNLGIKQAHANGKYKNAPAKTYVTKLKRGNLGHTEETKQLLREKALASPHRRLRKGIVEYKGIMMDSSWEVALAKRLDELGICWIRPEPVSWIDKEGISHNYFPDFYLPEHDLFLDPKNPQAVRVQKEKLDILLTQYQNIRIIKSLDECTTFSLQRGNNENKDRD